MGDDWLKDYADGLHGVGNHSWANRVGREQLERQQEKQKKKLNEPYEHHKQYYASSSAGSDFIENIFKLALFLLLPLIFLGMYTAGSSPYFYLFEYVQQVGSVSSISLSVLFALTQAIIAFIVFKWAIKIRRPRASSPEIDVAKRVLIFLVIIAILPIFNFGIFLIGVVSVAVMAFNDDDVSASSVDDSEILSLDSLFFLQEFQTFVSTLSSQDTPIVPPGKIVPDMVVGLIGFFVFVGFAILVNAIVRWRSK